MHGHGAPQPTESVTPSWRLLFTLGVAGGLAGLLVAAVYEVTITPIEAHRGRVIQEAIGDVLRHPARWDTLYLEEGKLVAQPVAGRSDLERIFLGYDESGRRIGVAATAAEPGFIEIISLMFGFDPESGRVLGMRILEQKETPGLGDKIERDSLFVRQFRGAIAPLKAVKRRTGDASEVSTISGATISSRAVVRIIDDAVARWRPLVLAYYAGGSR